jgi:GNAT superfamily N-acetyltransferase
MEIVPASPELWPAIADLFSAGGDPRWCWCQFWRKPGANWSNTTPDDNRGDLRALVGRDPAPGLVAIRDGRAVGWVGLGPRGDFPRLARSRTIPQLPGADVWVVNCFVVARDARRSGVAGALLAAAVEYARGHGARTLEGYPVRTDGERMSSAAAYTGTAAMFDRAGFAPASETTSRAGKGRPRIVARLEL